jgi:ankyrin repeat protein
MIAIVTKLQQNIILMKLISAITTLSCKCQHSGSRCRFFGILALFFSFLFTHLSAHDYFELNLAHNDDNKSARPNWLGEVSETGGELNEGKGWEVSSSRPFGVGQLFISIDTSKLSGDVALSFVSPNAANLAVQLYDETERIIAVDLLAHRQNINEETAITSLLVPISKYPTTRHIVLRRLDGPVQIEALSLMVLHTPIDQSEAHLMRLAQQLGDPLAEENPLLNTLTSQTGADHKTTLFAHASRTSQPLLSLSVLNAEEAIAEDELLLLMSILGLQGYDFNAIDFVRAAGEGREEVVRLYLRAGMPIDAQGATRYTATAEAATSGELRVLRLLCEQGADLEIRTAGGNTPLWMAASRANFEAIRLLVEHGADVNAQGARNETPAMILMRSRTHPRDHRLATLEYLLEAGSDPDRYDVRGRHLLHFAIPMRLQEVQAVLKYNPDLNHRNDAGLTPIMAAKYRNHRGIENALLEAGAEPWEPNFETLDDELIYRVHRREWHTLPNLIKAGANPNINDMDGDPLAFQIVRRLDIPFLMQMQELGLDLNAKARNGISLLASLNSQYQPRREAMIAYLLEQGLDPNQATTEDLRAHHPYKTPLMSAASQGNAHRCRLFLDAGADPTVRNSPGRTAAIKAERNGFIQLAHELKQAEIAWQSAQ